MMNLFNTKLESWLMAKSETFSMLCGETFTHGEVIVAHLAVAGLFLACGLAEWLEGGGALW